MKSYRKKFLLVQVCVVLASAVIFYVTPKSQEALILLLSIWNILSYLALFYYEIKFSNGFHPYMILCLIAAQFIGVNGISLYNDVSIGETIYLGGTNVTNSLLYGLIGKCVEHIILFWSFFYFEKNDKLNIYDNICASKTNYTKFAKKIYIIVWILRIINIGVPLSSISSFFSVFAQFGSMISLLLFLFNKIRNPNDSYSLNRHWIIAIIEICLVLNSGMKENIIRFLIPYCIYLIIMYKARRMKISFSFIFKLFFLAVFVIGFVFPYISVFRQISVDSGKSWSQITTSEALEEYQLYMTEQGKYADDNTGDRSVGYAMKRAGAIACNSLSIQYYIEKGATPEFFKYCLLAPVPRLIWRSKPQILTGQMSYRMSLGENNWLDSSQTSDQSTSISFGFIGSCILSFGLLIGLLIVVLIGYFSWYLWHLCKTYLDSSVIAIWTFLQYINSIMRDFDGLADCGISFLSINMVFIFLIKYLNRKNENIINRPTLC